MKSSEAQSPLHSPEWQIVAQRETALRRSRNLWQREYVGKPHPLTDEQREEAIKDKKLNLKLSRIVSDDADAEDAARESVKSHEEGFVHVTMLDAVRIGSLRRIENWKDKNVFSSIGWFDGITVGFFYGSIDTVVGKTAKPIAHWSGAVHMNKQVALNHIASGGLDILLTQMPFSETFASGNTEWVVEENRFVLTTQTEAWAKLRLTLSRATGCPQSLETVHVSTGKAIHIHQVMQTAMVDGFEVPSEIISFPVGRGQPGYLDDSHYKHSLKSCTLNEEVPDSAALLPIGTQVSDSRLGNGREVNYTIINGRLPELTGLEKRRGWNMRSYEWLVRAWFGSGHLFQHWFSRISPS